MKQITLGTTGITVPQNAFGALPIQRVSADEAVRLLRRAREGGMRFFDTARAYTDSEEKLGLAFGGQWDGLYVATKTAAKTPEALRADLETSLRLLQRDYIDIYQFHMAGQCYRPGDGTGMYEAMLEARSAISASRRIRSALQRISSPPVSMKRCNIPSAISLRRARPRWPRAAAKRTWA